MDQIWLYIAPNSVEAAQKVDDALHAAMRALARMPGMGHRRSDVDDPRILFWRVYSYLIAYRVERGTIVVVRVVHGARDIGRIFKGSK